MPVLNKYLNAEQTAEYLGIWKPELYNKYLNTGKLKPSFTVGQVKLYSIADIKKIKQLRKCK